MVSSDDSIIVSLKNSIVAKINALIGNHDSSNTAHTNIRNSIAGKADSDHTHGDITSIGTIGTTAGKPLITTTNGKITTSRFGTSSNTFAEGNHIHRWNEIDFIEEYTGYELISSNNDGKISAIGIVMDINANEIHFPTVNLYDDDNNQLAKISDIPSLPTLATVATSGSYNDLSDKPTIPSAYTHPTPSGLGGAKSSGFYKISTDAQGHITSTTSVTASDILALANIELVELEVAYTDDTTEKIKVLKYTGT